MQRLHNDGQLLQWTFQGRISEDTSEDATEESSNSTVNDRVNAAIVKSIHTRLLAIKQTSLFDDYIRHVVAELVLDARSNSVLKNDILRLTGLSRR